MKLFLHHDGALGDVLLSLPAVRAVTGKDDAVHFAGRPDVGTLLRELCIVAETSAAGDARFTSLYGGSADAGARAFLSQFGRAAVFTVDPGSPLVRAVKGAVSDTRVIVTAPPPGPGLHAAQYRLEQTGAPAPAGQVPLLRVPPLYTDLAAGMLSRGGYDRSLPLLAVHPGSGGAAKRWPLDRYLELLDGLHEAKEAFIMLFSGPAEDDGFKDRLDAFSGRFGMLHYADADLAGVAALLQMSDLYLGNDSGISHLAAAVGCRSLVLFGPTDPAVWMPSGPGVEIIRAADLAELPLAQVRDRVRAALAR